MDVFIRAPNEEDVQPAVQGNEQSKIVERIASIILHEHSSDIHKFDHMQRKFKIDQAIATDKRCQKATSECKPLPNYGNFRFLELNCVELSRL